MTADYTPIELMICCAARSLEDGCSVAVGTGIPCAAAMLAQKTHAPNLVILFEAGGLAPQLPTMPISVGDSRTYHRGLMASSMAEIMQTAQRGLVDYTFLGGAQIDPYGNLNSTVAGDYKKPQVRFPGSGGANDLASLCWRTMVVTQQNARRFVEKLDFLTTPGYLTGPGAREAAGLPPGGGPHRVITDLAILGYAAESCRMQVMSLHPKIIREQVQAATGFQLEWAKEVAETQPPTADQLRILRDEVDPRRYILGRAA